MEYYSRPQTDAVDSPLPLFWDAVMWKQLDPFKGDFEALLELAQILDLTTDATPFRRPTDWVVET